MKPVKLGYVEMHYNTHSSGILENIDYQWEGPPECEVTDELVLEMGYSFGEDIEIGPYKLKFIKRIPDMGKSAFMRQENNGN